MTQLVNSLLGIVVLPRERSFRNIPNITFTAMRQEGWQLPTIELNIKKINDLRQLIRVFRNAVAHFNLTILSDENNQIDRLKFYNKRKNKIVFEAIFTLRELRECLPPAYR